MNLITVYPKKRLVLSVALSLLISAIALWSGSDFSMMKAAGSQTPEKIFGPATIVLQNSYQLPATFKSDRPAGTIRPTTLASADFDADGFPDLVSGYSSSNGGYIVFQRGNSESFAPKLTENVQAISENRFPVPFLPSAKIVEFNETPDFIAIGDFDRDSYPDVIVAARGESVVSLASGDGHGGFAKSRDFIMPGRVTALVAGQIDLPDNLTDLVIGIEGDNGSSLLVYDGDKGLDDTPLSYSLKTSPQFLALGNFDDNQFGDLAVLADGNVSILHGRSFRGFESPEKTAARTEQIPLGFSARAIAFGEFIYDREARAELAALRDDGTVSFVARGELDTRPFTIAEARERRVRMHSRVGKKESLSRSQKDWQPEVANTWRVAEDLPVMETTSVNAVPNSTAPVLFNARLSGQSVDDLMVLDSSAQQLKIYTVQTPEKINGEVVSFAGPRMLMTIPATAAPIAALAMRVSLFSRPGLVYLRDGGDTPEIIPSAPTATFIVDRTDDAAASACTGAANDCSMRGSVTASNSLAGADIVTIPTGTYQLATVGADDSNTGGDMDVNGEITFNGTAAATTILQAGTTTANGIDKVMGYNPACTTAINGSMNNVTIRFGRNTTTFNPTFSQTGGGFDYCSGGASTLSITNSTFDSNTVSFAYGGGINFDSLAGTQTVSLTGLTITNNTTVNTPGSGSGAGGGGLNFFDSGVGNLTITNCTISNNNATSNSAPGGDGQGGGIYIRPQGGGSTLIQGSTISNNTAKSSGGGIAIAPTVAAHNVTIQTSTISGNTSNGTGTGNDAQGGGIWYQSLGGGTTTITKATITNNTANIAPTGNNRGGGGIAAGFGPLTMTFSRIVGNTASAGNGTGLRRDANSGAVSATNNWWGCNAGPAAAPCNTAVLVAGAGSLTTSPSLRLSHSASPTTLFVGGTSTLTADFLTNSASSAIAASNLDALIGVPITFGSAVNGTLSGAQPSIQSTGSATATFMATAVGTGTVNATVDAQTQPLATSITINPTTTASTPGCSGLAPSPLQASTTNKALLCFTLAANSTVNFTALNVPFTTAPNMRFTNARLFRSTDNDFSTAGDNTLVNSGTINATQFMFAGFTAFTGIDQIPQLSTTPTNFFVVADIAATVTPATPSSQPSVAPGNLTVASGNVTGATATGTNYAFQLATAASVRVSGRVLSSEGRGISKATITISDGNGMNRKTVSNAFGYYFFDGVPAGQTYIVQANRKGYEFSNGSQAVFVVDDLSGINFTALTE